MNQGLLGWPMPQPPSNKLILNFIASTDLATTVTLTTGAWTDVIPNQSFTTDDPSAIVEIVIGGFIDVDTGGGASCILGARAVVDSAGTPQNFRLGGDRQAAARFSNVLSGATPVVIPAGLSSGLHTVKIQVWTDFAATASCQCSTFPNQHALQIRIWQRR